MNEITTISNAIREERRTLDFKLGQFETLKTRKEQIDSDIDHLKTLSVTLDHVTVLLNSIGEDKQQQAQAQIEGIVTRGLRVIFGESFSFHILQTMKGKTASVEFVIRSRIGDDVLETSVLDSHGGGLAAIVGFLLRITIMLLDRGSSKANVLVLDETFGMVSENYLDELAAFVQELIAKTGIQIILITHQKEWIDYADKVYRFGIKSGVTYVQEGS